MVMTAQVQAHYDIVSLAGFENATLLESSESRESTLLTSSVSPLGGRSGISLSLFWVLTEHESLSNLSRRIRVCSR